MAESIRERMSFDPEEVERLLVELSKVRWSSEGSVALLVETPRPRRHVVRQQVDVVAGKGFAGDHAEKAYYRHRHVPGREVSAMSAEVLEILGVDPVVVGDNLITKGVDLTRLREGDCVRAGGVVLERSSRPHRPCATFRNRSSPEAFTVASRQGYRGALFVVRRGGVLRQGDPVHVLDRGRPEGARGS